MPLKKEEKFAWLPDASQTLSLQAALGNRETAGGAWQEIKDNALIEKLKTTSRGLFPLIYDNLQKHNLQDNAAMQFKIAHRETFRDNLLMFRKAEQILRNLHEAGIGTLLLKGAALSSVYYRSSALRPMGDIDVLIKRADFQKAVHILRENKWQPDSENLPLYIEIYPSCSFIDAEGDELDLHWQIMRECWNTDNTDSLWDDAVEAKIGNTPVKVLSPAHQLFHVCWHGVQYNPTPPIRWIADAVTILRKSNDELDWEKLVEIARLHRVNLMIFTALDYLDKNFAVEIPPEVLRRLKNSPLTGMQKTANILQMSENPMPWTRRQYLRYYIIKYLSLRSSTKLKPQSLVILKFLQYNLEVESFWQVPFSAFSKVFQLFILRRGSQ
jgi:hypothetical protein